MISFLGCYIINLPYAFFFKKKNILSTNTVSYLVEKKKTEIELVYMRVVPRIYKNITDFNSTPQVFVLWETNLGEKF